ncbi:MAG: SDR family oxidoreductase [bacterium]|nr:SDR family oxidoreductase [bacterium]
MMQDLKGKVAVITGSGKKTGIGFAIAKKLSSFGTNIIIADLGETDESTNTREPSKEMIEITNELAGQNKIKAIPIAVDVTDNDSINAMVDIIKSEFDQVDILCNNAGASFGVPNAVHTYDEELWMKTIDVNLHSVFKVSRAVLPLMEGRKGSIINTASRAGKVPPIANGAYAVAKAGVIMLTKVMAKELGATGIRINAICPGQIMTDLERWRFDLEAKFFNSTFDKRVEEMCKTIPLGHIGDPDDVAGLAAFLASKESAYITGQALNVSGGQLMEL